MKTNQIIKSYSVPSDLVMDIFRIILKNGLRQHIEGINERQNMLLIRIYFPSDSAFTKKIIENIESILSDYGYYASAGEMFNSEDDDEPNFESDYLFAK